MAASLLNLLLATSMLAHTVLGCCCHHAHPGKCAHVVADTATLHSDCGDHEHDHHALADDEARHGVEYCLACDSSHQRPVLCEEPDCTYVVAATVRFETMSPQTPAHVSAPPTSDASRVTCLTTADELVRVSTAGAGLRAALQVWQI